MKILIQVFIFLVPLFFLPITGDFFDYNKNMLLMFFSLLLLIFFFGKTILEKKLVFQTSPLDRPVLLFLLTYFLSFLFSGASKVESLLQPLGFGTILALTLFYFLGRQFFAENKTADLFLPLSVSAALLAILLFFQFSAPLLQPAFTPAGSLLALLLFFLIILIYLSTRIFSPRKKAKLAEAVFFILILAGFCLSLYLLFQPENNPQLLPYSAAWVIAIETLKSPLRALFGFGPAHFINAFTLGKPLSLNTNEYWLSLFKTSANYYFQILTETGLVGFSAFLYLLYSILKKAGKNLLLIVILLLFLLPINFLSLFVFILALTAAAKESRPLRFSPAKKPAGTEHPLASFFSENSRPEHPSAGPFFFLFFPFILAGLSGLYFLGRAYAAEAAMFQALKNLSSASSQETYDLELKAVNLNPYESSYRMIFSKTNLALADLLAQEEKPAENSREMLAQLVNQAILNGKIAVELSPSSLAWQNLAQIYTELIYGVEGADAWAVSSYNQAILFDPVNPSLRVMLGGLYYSLKLYSQAIRQFEIALSLKNDYVNAWYNLANAQREAGLSEEARFSYQTALILLQKESADYNRVQEELAALPQSAKEEVQPADLSELKAPPATPEAEIKTPLEIDEEAGPNLTAAPDFYQEEASPEAVPLF